MSPGLDGYTTEFYKFFWNDISEFLLKSYNYSLVNGSFSVSQRQGLITCIPKEGKNNFFVVEKLETNNTLKCRH